MLRVIDQDGKSVGYKCSECLNDVMIHDTVCESCGRELVYPYFMPSTIWWDKHTPEERKIAREHAFDITVALVIARGTDWRDVQAPFNRFLGGEHAERFIEEHIGEISNEEVEEIILLRGRGFFDFLRNQAKVRKEVREEIISQRRALLRQEVIWEPKKEYPYASKIFSVADIKEMEGKLPPTLVHEKYLL